MTREQSGAINYILYSQGQFCDTTWGHRDYGLCLLIMCPARIFYFLWGLGPVCPISLSLYWHLMLLTILPLLVFYSLSVPDGLALDPIDKKIYWIDSGSKKIERADMDGSNRVAILTFGASEYPRGIVLYRANRFVIHIYL